MKMASGVLDVLSNGNGFLRQPETNYLPSDDDVFVPPGMIQKYGLRTGDFVEGPLDVPGEGNDNNNDGNSQQADGNGSDKNGSERDEKKESGSGRRRRRRRRRRKSGGGGSGRGRAPALASVSKVDGEDPADCMRRPKFENLLAEHPDHPIMMSTGEKDRSMRVIDLMIPIGRGQRALIVAPARTGKTVLMQQMARGICTNDPETTLFILLVGERPEEVVEMKREGHGEVVWSSFDDPPERQAKVADLVVERAKRLVERGRHVVILLDSITRLARAHNSISSSQGRTLSGGVGARALEKPKKIFGAARKIPEGGSLTILGTALVDTGSRMDEVIFEEFKGTGNAEIHLTRQLMDKRIFPTIDLLSSGTRREELLFPEDTLEKRHALRRVLSDYDPVQAMTKLLEAIRDTESNDALLERINV